MPDWATFVGLSGVVLVFLLFLARASQGFVTGDDAGWGTDPTLPDPERFDAPESDHDSGFDSSESDHDAGSDAAAVGPAGTEWRATDDGDPDGSMPDAQSPPRQPPVLNTLDDRQTPELSSLALLANVTLSQVVLGSVLVVGAVLTEIPASALGLAEITPGTVALGVGLGLALYVVNEAGGAVASRLGFDHSETLRELLAPDSLSGWILLLVVVLPVIAGFEEFLFRAALIGVVSAGYGVSPWVVAVLSSVAFGIGHGAQGRAGIAVTTALGFVLAAAFVLTDSFVVVFVAHYLINALEFLVHEGLGVEWID